MASDFSSPESKRLPLADGRWIDVKTELTYGEEKVLQGYAIYAGRQGQEDSGPEYARWFIKRLATWITDWNLTDNGKPVLFSEAALEALKPSTADEIETVLNQHIEDAAKNAESASQSTISSMKTTKTRTTRK